MKVALIVDNKVFNLLGDMEEIPDWPPYPDGTKPLLVDVSLYPEVAEGDDYDPVTGEITYQIIEETEADSTELNDEIIEE